MATRTVGLRRVLQASDHRIGWMRGGLTVTIGPEHRPAESLRVGGEYLGLPGVTAGSKRQIPREGRGSTGASGGFSAAALGVDGPRWTGSLCCVYGIWRIRRLG